jgi:hypothetical protein
VLMVCPMRYGMDWLNQSNDCPEYRHDKAPATVASSRDNVGG